LDVASDADAMIERLDADVGGDVLQLILSGQLDLAGLQKLRVAISRAGARVRSLAVDMAELRLLPTEEDIAALNADGYLGEVIADLRDRQLGQGTSEDSEIAFHALGLLTTLLAERKTTGAST
jgi:hypothetical protein